MVSCNSHRHCEVLIGTSSWNRTGRPLQAQPITCNKISKCQIRSDLKKCYGQNRISRTGLIFFLDEVLEIFLNLQGSEFIQTLLLIYNHLAKFVVYKG